MKIELDKQLLDENLFWEIITQSLENSNSLETQEKYLIKDKLVGRIPDEVNDEDAAALHLGKIKMSLHSPKWWFLEFMRLLLVCDESIQIDVRVDFAKVLPVVVRRMQFVDVDDQRLHILHVKIQLHRGVNVKGLLIVIRKVEVNAFL